MNIQSSNIHIIQTTFLTLNTCKNKEWASYLADRVSPAQPLNQNQANFLLLSLIVQCFLILPSLIVSSQKEESLLTINKNVVNFYFLKNLSTCTVKPCPLPILDCFSSEFKYSRLIKWLRYRWCISLKFVKIYFKHFV